MASTASVCVDQYVPWKVVNGIKRYLRPVIIDGFNVAMIHGLFSIKYVYVVAQHWLREGHAVKVVLKPLSSYPELQQSRMRRNDEDIRICRWDLLDELEAVNGLVTWASPGKHYDDLFLLELAVRFGGIVISRDLFRDCYKYGNEFRAVIKDRRLALNDFVDDDYFPVLDPGGRGGPSLTEFVLFAPGELPPRPRNAIRPPVSSTGLRPLTQPSLTAQTSPATQQHAVNSSATCQVGFLHGLWRSPIVATNSREVVLFVPFASVSRTPNLVASQPPHPSAIATPSAVAANVCQTGRKHQLLAAQQNRDPERQNADRAFSSQRKGISARPDRSDASFAHSERNAADKQHAEACSRKAVTAFPAAPSPSKSAGGVSSSADQGSRNEDRLHRSPLLRDIESPAQTPLRQESPEPMDFEESPLDTWCM